MSKIIHKWKQISLIEEDVVLPTGQAITHTTIHHPGAAVILPITAEGHIVLVHQFRPSLNKWLLELPAGTREGNEEPLCCAKRELEEETGLVQRNSRLSAKSPPLLPDFVMRYSIYLLPKSSTKQTVTSAMKTK